MDSKTEYILKELKKHKSIRGRWSMIAKEAKVARGSLYTFCNNKFELRKSTEEKLYTYLKTISRMK